jgi:hypothetical protein
MNMWNIKERLDSSFLGLDKESENLKKNNIFSFTKKYTSLTEILVDHKLASLGDAYINLVYSLVISNKKGEPSGAKVKGTLLAGAIKKSGLRDFLPSRMTRHTMADAAEALVAYAWINNHVNLEESVKIIERADDPVEGFSQLLTQIRSRIIFSS